MEIPPRWGRGMRKQGVALQQLLQVLMNLLVKKDTNKWFSVPMNDRIAPGYSGNTGASCMPPVTVWTGCRGRWWWWVCTLLSMTGTTCLQQFSVSPSSLLVFPGTNVTMVCRVYNILGQCRWEKDGKPVGMYPDKYTLPKC